MVARGSTNRVPGGKKGRGHNAGIDLRTRVASSINGVIASYLHEWYEHAASRHDKLQFVYRRALVSVLEHPTMITDVRMLESLRGIGPGIRSRIEKCLLDEGRSLLPATADVRSVVETSEDRHLLTTIDVDIYTGDANLLSPSPLSPRQAPSSSSLSSIASTTAIGKRRTRRPAKEYIPAFRSGPYAMLIALYIDSRSPSSRGYLLRTEIARLGQSYCINPFDEGGSGSGSMISPLQGAIKTLTAKGLVERTGHPARFTLTEPGQALAERLWNAAERRSSVPLTEPDGDRENEHGGDTENDLFALDISTDPASSQKDLEACCLEAGQYDIVLLVDTREVRAVDERNYFVDRLRELGVRCEQRSMELGDFLWIARDRRPHSNIDEIVLDYVIERKLESDLIQSIVDGRFLEQKFRLRNSGLKNKIYLVERGDDTDFGSIGQDRFEAAIMQTQIIDGLYLRYTAGAEDSVRFLTTLHGRLLSKHEAIDLWAGSMAYPVDRSRYLDGLGEWEQIHGKRCHQTYGCYTQLNHKSANLTAKDLFMKQLLCIRQLSADKASLIVEKFPTFAALYQHYQGLSDEKEREEYFRGWLVEGDSRRRFGPALSRRIYQLFTHQSYKDSNKE